jgi:hypothetical protein
MSLCQEPVCAGLSKPASPPVPPVDVAGVSVMIRGPTGGFKTQKTSPIVVPITSPIATQIIVRRLKSGTISVTGLFSLIFPAGIASPPLFTAIEVAFPVAFLFLI